ncbi:MAG: tetratricopeptide repeat protein [Polyangiaceae bacterium]|nr:tetratricopeptide repeat protein [Polyangiaceae bacterium]
MRPWVLSALIGLAGASFVLTNASPAAAQDFGAGGRKKPGKPGKPAQPGKPGKPTKPGKPAQPGTGTDPGPGKPSKPSKPDDGGGEKSKDPEVLIKRYTTIVLSQPGVPFPLQRLAQLYRERDGNLKKLVEELEKKAGATGDDAWASKIALAGVLKMEGRYDDAIKTYEGAVADKPKEPAPLLALAQLEVDRGDKKAGTGHYEKALPLLKEGAEIEQTTRTLMTLSVELKDFDAARKHHAALVKRSQGSLFVKAELGRAFLNKQHYDLAEAEFRELVKASAGDNRALGPALRDLGNALAKQKKTQEALETLKKALTVSSGSAGIRAEILVIMTDAFRSEGKLSELIAILEKETGQDFQRLATLGSLYEETGNVEKALSTYRKALSIDGSHIDTRVKVVHLLQTAGELDAATKEYEALIRAAPNNPDFVFELCETLLQRGDRPKALKLLKELEGRAQEADVLAAVADFYERMEEKEKAMALLQRLAGTGGGGDPTFLIDLGDRYYQAGDKKKALDTWARVRTLVPGRARASFTLGEVYLEHDMPEEALEALREAVTLEPANIHYKKALAIALERTAPGTPLAGERFSQAVAIWEELLKGAKNDTNLSREARTHIVSIWSVTKELSNRVAPLKQRFEADPPDLEAGRLLAEVQRKLAKLPEAEATLRAVIAKAPGDEASLLALENVLVRQQNLRGAIEVLQKLAELNDKQARQYYQRMAQYAAELYKDDEAIRYAAKAVELSPEDANGHQKLGDMYRKRQDFTKAMAEYRQAIAKNDRLWPVYFDLAELQLSAGESAEADRLFRRVVRASGDEELVARAARMSMQINLGKGTLESLERELLPVAVGNPQKAIYRRLLVEIYGAMTLPLVQKVRHGEDPAQVEAARTQLSAIGSRAVKPLLDALADDREAQQRVAIEVLAYVENKSGGPTLFNYATGGADKDLRVRAMIAVGALRDPAMLTKLEELLAPKNRDASVAPSDEIAVAAAWAVARTKNDKAETLLVKLLESPSPDVRAVAAIGLGLTKNKKHAPALLKMVRAADSGPTARSSAVLALGHLSAANGGGDKAAASENDKTVRELAAAAMDANDTSLRRAGLAVSARMAHRGTKEDDPTMLGLANAMLSSDAALVRDAIAAAAVLDAADPSTRSASSQVARGEPLPVPDGKLEIAGVQRALLPQAPAAEARVRVLVSLSPWIARAAAAAVATSPERASTIADALSEGTVLAPFAAAAREASPESRAAAEKATREILAATTQGFTALTKHPEAGVRTRAAAVIAKTTTSTSDASLAQVLASGDDEVRRAILSSVNAGSGAGVVVEVAKLAQGNAPWAVRVRATETLGRIGSGAGKERAVAALTALATKDSYALVREAALTSLARVDRAVALPILKKASSSDEEPHVRELAKKLLDGDK